MQVIFGNRKYCIVPQSTVLDCLSVCLTVLMSLNVLARLRDFMCVQRTRSVTVISGVDHLYPETQRAVYKVSV